MVKSIAHTSTLVYYDYPQVIEARDQIGGTYVAFALDSSQGGHKFLVVGVQPAKLRQLRRGEIDLRSLLIESEENGWYVCETESIEEPIALEQPAPGPLPSTLLPGDRFFVSTPVDSSNRAMSEAINRWNFVVHIEVIPLKHRKDKRLILRDYGTLVLRFHDLIVSSSEVGANRFEEVDPSTLSLDIVAPRDKESLAVLLEASYKDDRVFSPYSLLTSAVKKIDRAIEQFEKVDTPVKLTENFEEDFVEKFLTLMDAIAHSDALFQYSWAEPRFRDGNIEKVSPVHALRFVNSMKDTVAAIGGTIEESKSRVFEQSSNA